MNWTSSPAPSQEFKQAICEKGNEKMERKREDEAFVDVNTSA